MKQLLWYCCASLKFEPTQLVQELRLHLSLVVSVIRLLNSFIGFG